MIKVENVDEYISLYPKSTQELLQNLRKTIQFLVPGANEKLSYGIPTYVMNGKNFVHFAGYEHHIGFYPGPNAIKVFAEELSKFKTSKGTIQLQIDKPIPYDLIMQIVSYCVEQNMTKLNTN